MIRRSFLLALGAVAQTLGAPSAWAQPVAVTIDQQTYASNLAADPHRSDPANLHIGASGGTPTAQAYLHLDFASIRPGATISRISLRLLPNGVPQDNIGNPELAACVLAERLKPGFDPSKDPRPAYDCARALVPGLRGQDGSWTFQIDPLVKLWQQFGNTGLAVALNPPTPAAPGAPVPTSTWQAAFAKTGSTVSANLLPAPPPTAAPEPDLAAITVTPTLLEIPTAFVPELPAEIAPSISAPPVKSIERQPLIVSMRWILVTLAALALILGILLSGAVQSAWAEAGARISTMGAGLRTTYSQKAEVIGALLLIAVIAAGLIGRVASQAVKVP